MALVDLELPPARDEPLPDRIRQLVSVSTRRVEKFLEQRDTDLIPGFVPADIGQVYRALRHVVDGHLAPGNAFCEWGSGFGGVALAAAFLRFDSHGIEIHPDLVAESQALAAEVDLPVEFVCGTFLPPGHEGLADVPQEFGWLEDGGDNAYETLYLDPSDFDVVFAYPWPGEESVILNLFDEVAATGALLLTFHGDEGVRVRRKA